MSHEKIKVIIAGAGIAGLTLAIALRRLPYIEVEVFEQATELREIGASIAISPNGLRSLERLGVLNALEEAIGFRNPSGVPMIFRHWETDEIIREEPFVDVPLRRHQTARFHRAQLQSALLEHVPPSIIHVKKRIARAEASDDHVALFFADGTSAVGEVLIGADGIHSNIRKTFFPNHRGFPTGKVWLRSAFPYSTVENIPSLPADSAQWWGPKGAFMASRMGKDLFTTVCNFDLPIDTIKDIQSSQEGSVEVLRQRFQSYSPVVQALAHATPYTRAYPNYAGEPLSTWLLEQRVTIAGDAAHPHGGAFAAGGSLAIDDAYALFLAFEHALGRERTCKPTLVEIQCVLAVYDQTRRPHASKLCTLVLEGLRAQSSITRADDNPIDRVNDKPNATWLS
ncbi:hypothetical protein BDV25DRAFT_172659 [Aspergillus avenaceus]|uniref:FAD-binding domain-containing protein n=1 Tax=Aspergillus avenaceus TaxID=36643 RepID=A0A5N6TTW1_ASPAV|nr:hypothetical protein BDV25DRAFT_172659 [Aspergillus avenaceus]